MGNNAGRQSRSLSIAEGDHIKDGENWMKDLDPSIDPPFPNLAPYSTTGGTEDDFEQQQPRMRHRAKTLSSSNKPIDRKKLPTVFKWDGGGKNVFISGSFNNWKKKIPMAKSSCDFYAIIELPEGTHQYKFHVDGQWLCDPTEPKSDKSITGIDSNYVIVHSSDYEVFEALAMDQIKRGKLRDRNPSIDEGNNSPPGEYTQDIPGRLSSISHAGPPILPPHLLQVILNKEIPVHCEPTLLPEPNHVMLNHLYALSIKDGVMVLSATHRYRKKYVTTLLYKPI